MRARRHGPSPASALFGDLCALPAVEVVALAFDAEGAPALDRVLGALAPPAGFASAPSTREGRLAALARLAQQAAHDRAPEHVALAERHTFAHGRLPARSRPLANPPPVLPPDVAAEIDAALAAPPPAGPAFGSWAGPWAGEPGPDRA